MMTIYLYYFSVHRVDGKIHNTSPRQPLSHPIMMVLVYQIGNYMH